MRILQYVRTIIFIYGGSLNGLFHHGLVWSQIMYIYVRTTQRLYLRSEERSANALRNKHHYIFNCLLRSFKYYLGVYAYQIPSTVLRLGVLHGEISLSGSNKLAPRGLTCFFMRKIHSNLDCPPKKYSQSEETIVHRRYM